MKHGPVTRWYEQDGEPEPKLRKPMRRSNPKRRRRAYARNFGDRAEILRSDYECFAAGFLRDYYAKHLDLPTGCQPCAGNLQAMHTRARGMGGVKGSRRHLVAACAIHHLEAGEHGTTARLDCEERYHVDLDALAERIADDLDEQGIP